MCVNNSGVNVLLVSASSKAVSHAYSCLSWLAKAYSIYLGAATTVSTAYTADYNYAQCHYTSIIASMKERSLHVLLVVGSKHLRNH